MLAGFHQFSKRFKNNFYKTFLVKLQSTYFAFWWLLKPGFFCKKKYLDNYKWLWTSPKVSWGLGIVLGDIWWISFFLLYFPYNIFFSGNNNLITNECSIWRFYNAKVLRLKIFFFNFVNEAILKLNVPPSYC